MVLSNNHHRSFGAKGLLVPPVAFRADVLDDSLRVLPAKTKRLICAEWLSTTKPPVLIDVVLNERNSSHLTTLGRLLTQLDVPPDEIIINLEVESLSDSPKLSEPHPPSKQIDKACELLGKNHSPRFVTLRLATGDAFDSLRDLELLKTRHQLAAVGVALHDWRLGPALLHAAPVDFIKLSGGPTVLRHPPQMLEWLAGLAVREIPVITAGVFHGGFLVGGPTFNGSIINPVASSDQSLFTWRKAFTALCHGHGVRPAHACVQFALRVPGVTAVSLKTSSVDRVVESVLAATTPVPSGLWESMKEEGLLADDCNPAPTRS